MFAYFINYTVRKFVQMVKTVNLFPCCKILIQNQPRETLMQAYKSLCFILQIYLIFGFI